MFLLSSKKLLKNHVAYIHAKEEEDEPKWKCAECSKTFRIEAGYKLHMSNHEAEREAQEEMKNLDKKI